MCIYTITMIMARNNRRDSGYTTSFTWQFTAEFFMSVNIIHITIVNNNNCKINSSSSVEHNLYNHSPIIEYLRCFAVVNMTSVNILVYTSLYFYLMIFLGQFPKITFA